MRLFKRKAAPVTRYSATQRLLTDWLNAGNLAVVLADNPQEYDALKGNPGLRAVTGNADDASRLLDRIRVEVGARESARSKDAADKRVLVLVDGMGLLMSYRASSPDDDEAGAHNAAIPYVRNALRDITLRGRAVGVRVLIASSRADVAVSAPGLLKANLEARILGRDVN